MKKIGNSGLIAILLFCHCNSNSYPIVKSCIRNKNNTSIWLGMSKKEFMSHFEHTAIKTEQPNDYDFLLFDTISLPNVRSNPVQIRVRFENKFVTSIHATSYVDSFDLKTVSQYYEECIKTLNDTNAFRSKPSYYSVKIYTAKRGMNLDSSMQSINYILKYK